MQTDADVKIKSNVDEVQAEMAHAILRGLKAIGEKAIDYAKGDCPVDSGRLRNSITYAVSDGTQGGANNKDKAKAEAEDYAMHGTPEENTLVIGTNVVYAPPQEFSERFVHKTGKAHFLRDAISTHGDEYKKTMEASIKAV